MGALVAPPMYASISDRINQAFQHAFSTQPFYVLIKGQTDWRRVRRKVRLRNTTKYLLLSEIKTRENQHTKKSGHD